MRRRRFDALVRRERRLAEADVLPGGRSRVARAIEPVADASIGSEHVRERAGASHFAAVKLGDGVELRIAAKRWQAVLGAEPRDSGFHAGNARLASGSFRGWGPLGRAA